MVINRVYTRVGDDGKTALIGGERVQKSSERIECYGTVDELNATFGLVRCALLAESFGTELASIIERVQNELFNLGCALATPDAEKRKNMPVIEARHVEALEAEIDRFNADLPELTSFVLPGGGMVSAYFHLARTVCRRAERHVVGLSNREDVEAVSLVYLNRLSDACFVFGRYAVKAAEESETLWQPEST